MYFGRSSLPSHDILKAIMVGREMILSSTLQPRLEAKQGCGDCPIHVARKVVSGIMTSDEDDAGTTILQQDLFNSLKS
jgi:hypothetical protein